MAIKNPTRLSGLLPRLPNVRTPVGLIYLEISPKQIAAVWYDSKVEYRRTSFWYLPVDGVEVRVFECDGFGINPKVALNDAPRDAPWFSEQPPQVEIKLIRLPLGFSFPVDRSTHVVLEVNAVARMQVEKIGSDGRLNCRKDDLVGILGAPGANKYFCWTVVETDETATLERRGLESVSLEPGLHAWWRFFGYEISTQPADSLGTRSASGGALAEVDRTSPLPGTVDDNPPEVEDPSVPISVETRDP